jgi:hypothetical protein
LQREDEALREMAIREFSKGPADMGCGSKDRWKIRMRIETQAHSIRAGVLKEWNETIRSVKFIPVQGSKRKTELILEIMLGDNVPMGRWDARPSHGPNDHYGPESSHQRLLVVVYLPATKPLL